jgi:hypothetical protein
MIHEADLHRLDAEARRVANDNRPSATEYPYRDEDEGIYTFMRETRQSLFRGLGYVLFAVVVIVGCIVAFHAGHAAGSAL